MLRQPLLSVNRGVEGGHPTSALEVKGQSALLSSCVHGRCLSPSTQRGLLRAAQSSMQWWGSSAEITRKCSAGFGFGGEKRSPHTSSSRRVPMPWWGSVGPAIGLLHMGHTQRTSSHFTRHLWATSKKTVGGWLPLPSSGPWALFPSTRSPNPWGSCHSQVPTLRACSFFLTALLPLPSLDYQIAAAY